MWSNDQEKNFIENVKDDFFPLRFTAQSDFPYYL